MNRQAVTTEGGRWRAWCAKLTPFSLPLLGGMLLLLQFVPGIFILEGGGLAWTPYKWATLMALLCFWGFAFLGSRLGEVLVQDREPAGRDWNFDVAMAVGLAALAGGFLIKVRHCTVDPGVMASCAFKGASAWAPNLVHRAGVCVVLLSLLEAPAPRRERAVKWILAGYLAWCFAAGAGRFEIIASTASLCAVLWFSGGQRWRGPLLVLLVLAVPAFLLKSWIKYRMSLAPDDFASLGPWSFIYEAFFARISQHEIVSAILDSRDQSRLGIYGWPDFFHALLNQPLVYLDGNDLGRAFAVLGPYEFTTGVGPTFLGDFFLMGGGFGVALGMAGVGLGYGALNVLVRRRGTPALVLTFSVLLPILVHGMEDWFFLTMARAVQAGGVCLAISWLVGHLSAHRPFSVPLSPGAGEK